MVPIGWGIFRGVTGRIGKTHAIAMLCMYRVFFFKYTPIYHVKLTFWARDLSKMEDICTVGIDRIEKLLRYHAEHVGD